MLTLLQVENIALIQKSELQLSSGFTVITGETGAGKSLLIDAINAIMGQRVSRDLIRQGHNKAKVTAVFNHINQELGAYLDFVGIEYTDNELILTREMFADGRNICRANSIIITVAVLHEIGSYLINLHGQHETQQLLTPASHIKYLDTYAELGELLGNYQLEFKRYRDIKNEIDQYDLDEKEKARKVDYLNSCIDEIENANLILGEDDSLTDRKKILNHAEQIKSELQRATNIFYGEEFGSGVLEEIDDASDAIETLSNLGTEYSKLSERLTDIKYELRDISESIRDYYEDFEYSPEEINEIEERLDVIFKLKRKYGSSIEEILTYLQNAQTEVNNITHSTEHLEKLQKQANEQLNIVLKLAKKLSDKRVNASKQLIQSMNHELKELDMNKALFDINIESSSLMEKSLTENGIDNIYFEFTANAGEQLKPLSKIASGGELSRIMLALKNVLADKDQIETMIFDEIDTGISGHAAQAVAVKLAELGKVRQVLCVTHLPQITSIARNHFLIVKKEENERTVTSVNELSSNERITEIARMIGGDVISDTTRNYAKEMLINAEKYWK